MRYFSRTSLLWKPLPSNCFRSQYYRQKFKINALHYLSSKWVYISLFSLLELNLSVVLFNVLWATTFFRYFHGLCSYRRQQFYSGSLVFRSLHHRKLLPSNCFPYQYNHQKFKMNAHHYLNSEWVYIIIYRSVMSALLATVKKSPTVLIQGQCQLKTLV